MTDAPDRIVRRGGNGPLQPEWNDVVTLSAEWYRRFREWHRETYPDADKGTRGNLDMLVALAEDRQAKGIGRDSHDSTMTTEGSSDATPATR